MNIIDFWQKQVDLWNEEKKCGLCFEFSAPLVNSQINIVQSETCCVNIFLTDIRFKEDRAYNNLTGLVTSKTCVWTFTLHALTTVPLGLNNYNEIKGHEIDESKWNTVFYPIIECLGCDNILDFCDIIGKKLDIRQIGDAQLVHNYLDSNWNGWRINYSFTQIT